MNHAFNLENCCKILQQFSERSITEEEKETLHIAALGLIFIYTEHQTESFAQFIASNDSELTEEEQLRIRQWSSSEEREK